jgi:hypothetical protein
MHLEDIAWSWRVGQGLITNGEPNTGIIRLAPSDLDPSLLLAQAIEERPAPAVRHKAPTFELPPSVLTSVPDCR